MKTIVLLTNRLFFSFILTAFTFSAFSQINWTGATDSDWNTAGNWDSGSVPTATDDVRIPNVATSPIISGGVSAVAKSVWVRVNATLTVSGGGTLTVKNGSSGFINSGTTNNSGTIIIESNGTGLLTESNSNFNNQSGGILQIDGGLGQGISNSGTITNDGSIKIGTNTAVDEHGLGNIAIFQNNALGTVEIKNTGGSGIFNASGEIAGGGASFGAFKNFGTVKIGENGSIGSSGINNNSGATFDNSGTITIGENGTITANGIFEMFATLNNLACAQIKVFDNLNVVFGSFNNSGLLTLITSETHTPGFFQNDGIVEDVQNTFPLGGNLINNDIIVKPIGGLFCQAISPTLIIGGANSFSVESIWFKDPALATQGGTYDSGTNAFSDTHFGDGNHTGYFKATDNVNSCDFTVSIALNLTPDNVNPSVICKNATLSLDGTGNKTLIVADVFDSGSDNCSTSADLEASGSLSQTAFDCSNIGMHMVTLTVTDGSSNTGNCTATVNVQDDEMPTVNCKTATLELDNNGDGVLTVDDVFDSASDNCASETDIKNSGNLNMTNFDCSHIGTQSVTLSVNDGNGNSNSCLANISVADNSAPTFTSCPTYPTAFETEPGECFSTISFTSPTATDNCNVDKLEVRVKDSAGAVIVDWTNNANGDYVPGDYTIEWRATDDSGNSNICSEPFNVKDDQAPTAVCVPDFTIQLNNGQATVTVNDIDDGSSDNCGISSLNFSLNQTIFDCDDRGTKTAILTVTDLDGNQDQCTTDITVLGTTLSIEDLTKTEGNWFGFTYYVIKVERSQGGCLVEFDYAAEDGTAKVSDWDYLPVTGSNYFPPSTGNVRYVLALVRKDNKFESDESFFINITTSTPGITVTKGTGEYTILNDDAAPLVGNNDGKNIVSTDQNFNQIEGDFKIWPNPANNYLNLSAPFDWFEKGALDAAIYDNNGRKILAFDLSDNLAEFDISALQSGTYQFVVRQKNGQTFVQRFVKMN